MAMSDFTIIRRSLTGRMFSTVTTVVTVAVAVGLMLVLLSMRDAGRQAFERGSGNMELLISRDASPLVSVLNGVFYANPPARPIEWTKFEELRDAYPFEFAIPTQQGDSYRGFPTMATTREFFTQFKPDLRQGWSLAAGRFFERPFEVVLGARVAKATGLKIGDRINLTHGAAGAKDAHVHHEYDYEVVGILNPTGGSHDRAVFTDLTSTWLIHAHDRRKRENPSVATTTEADLTDADRKITGIYARTASRPGSTVSAAWQVVFDQLRRDPTLTVAAPSKEIDKLFVIVGNVDQIILGLAAVVMVSSGIGIMLALYNSMEQRRRQIAVLRVLGASRARIFGLVLTESALLGVMGGLAGYLVFVVGSRVVAAEMKERVQLVIEPVLAADWTMYVLAGTIVLASAAGIVPAVMAYRTSVARNLRPLG